MFITKAKKFHNQEDGTIVSYDYYRLTKSYRDSKGVSRKCSVLCLGTLDGFTKTERNELADMLTSMIEEGQSVMHDNQLLYEKAMDFYVKYRESKYAQENDTVLKAEAERKELEQLKTVSYLRENTALAELFKVPLVDSDAKARKRTRKRQL